MSPAHLALAAAFLTRLPVPTAWQAGGTGAVAAAMPVFPVVGVAVGALAGAAGAAAWALGLPAGVAAVLVVAVEAGLTGGLHADGLADSADGLAAGGPAERRLAAMRDSGLGAHGALALGLALGAQGAALASLPGPVALLAASAAAGALGRAALVAVAALPPAAQDGLARFAGRASRRGAGLAAVVGLLGAGLALRSPGLAALAGLGAALAAAVVAALARRHLGGATGDVLGAAAVLAATGALATLAGGMR